MTSTQPVPEHNLIVALEHESLNFWDKHNIFALSLEKNIHKKHYIFYDGPPFATGLPHHGHLLASTLKDIIPRYMTMQGYYVKRQFGWDCHGLPIEHEINKSLGLHAHEAVEQLGIAGYNAACKAIVMRYREQWYNVIRRIGRWVDMDNDYKTMDVTFMESVWWTFAQLWQQDLIYKGSKIVPYSCALETVLSNFEAGSNYQDIQDPSVIVHFSLKETILTQMCDILVWTTTPWTLPSNLLLCVHPDADYALLSIEGQSRACIIAKDRIDCIKETYTVLHALKGFDLIGMHYESLYSGLSDDPSAYRIVGDTYVSMDTGTGIVHIAPAYGEDDQRIALTHGLTTVLDPLDASGHFTDVLADLDTKGFKEADSIIIRTLKNQGRIYHHSTIVHSYPMCPRSDTPLMYRAVPSWYIRVTALKERMLRINESIHWVPEHIKHGRFGKWLASAKDWAISRNRVWGTPLPLWINDVSGDVICMDSRATLERYTGIAVDDLHREHIDGLSFSLPGLDGVYRRIPEVLDCWFESGSMPWAQNHYPFSGNAELFSDFFPADFIAEGLDQTRGWFYTLTVIAAALKEETAFKNVIVNGIVTAEDGKKMSKRLKNYTAPMELMECYGADALRLYMIHSGLVKAEEQRFSNQGVENMARVTLLPWVNAVKFFDTYAETESWSMPSDVPSLENPLDKWIMSKSAHLIQQIHESMAEYHLYQIVTPLLQFVDELTNTYIRMNRPRFWGTEETGADPKAFYTLFRVLLDWTICMAPFTPMVSEAMYQRLKKYSTDTALSVHLLDYPQAQSSHIDQHLEESIYWMQKIITMGRQKRNLSRVPIKTPLLSLTVIHRDSTVLKRVKEVEDLITHELNIQMLSYSFEEDTYVSVSLKPNSRILGKRLGPAFKEVFEALKNLPSADIRKAESIGKIDILTHTITRDEWQLECTAKNDAILTDGTISILLDTFVNEDCKKQGKAREIISYIQKLRKHDNLHVSDRITLSLLTHSENIDIIAIYKDLIQKETLAEDIETHLLLQSSDSSRYFKAAEDVYIAITSRKPHAH